MQSSITNSCKILDGTSSSNGIYIKILLGLMVMLQIGDGVLTHKFAGKGLVGESNILLNSVINSGCFVIIKIIGAAFCCAVLWFLYKRFKTLTILTISSIVVFYSLVMVWNLNVILRYFIR